MNDRKRPLPLTFAATVEWKRRFRQAVFGAIWGLAGLASVMTTAARAEPNLLADPFPVRNQSPFILVYGLPAARSAALLSEGGSNLQLQIDITNHSKTSDTTQERIILDGETYRAALIYQYGFADGWQLGLELPLISHHAGYMDNFIEDWHDFFGLSNSDREPWPKNRLLFSYSEAGVTQAELSKSADGIGDLQLQVSHRLTVAAEDMTLAINASLKLPTGDAERFQGSGATDLALWLSASAPTLIEAWRVGGYLQAGMLLLGDGDLLPERQRSRVWFGGAGVHWQAWPWLMLKAQLDTHGAFYDSQLAQLGKRSVMLTVGGSIPLQQGAGAVDLAIGENLGTDAVPDFMINLGYRHRF